MASFILPAIMGGSSLISGLLGNRKQTVEKTTKDLENIDIKDLPSYDPKLAQFRDELINMFLSQAQNVPDFAEKYKAAGLQDINQGADIASGNLQNLLTSKGLGRSSAGFSASAMPELSRLAEQNRFLAGVPLLQQQMQSDALSRAGSFFGTVPKGSQRTGTTERNTTEKSTGSGNALAGGFGSLATSLAGLYGQGAFGGQAPGGAPVSSSPTWSSGVQDPSQSILFKNPYEYLGSR